ncbi:shikimate kinase [Oribacterium sp. NK2B42]|uniref:shikimate kinase n=1 Tax=Oribacterium sp. NK2B42 TaxID=689781 RepID=UPI000423B63D|nr:shikimate kinase [Oribacterium sp. NK2B42]
MTNPQTLEKLKKKNIALIGFMGAGKSTVSSCLKDMLGMTEVDTDAEIVRREGMPINEIFEKHGEDYFRKCESEVILDLQKSSGIIISCGGGAVLREENVTNLKKGSIIVLLTATPETTLERVKDSDVRPILNGNMNVEFIRSLQEKRNAKYEAAADIIIATDGKTVQEICEELVQAVVNS